ncbi:probable RKI1-D-ribose-5-phosphate ketol-isomerase [Sporisorium reilianum SRZ2]|uniref:Ribose-5-phosphate isomerase n=2 Tax=Sporisorium reilianum TaxID=72558 RepID=E6ZNA5_SPORE|nr:probable RKI1-D-ribose-5-phosphate ketol-isomerase [Sporisorium reilianum SRZ2]SJX64398.1 probable RKI1-D-ribose-5-phosphate ketol-isomerase [Sporisorium reilianum f. sp. reilianum]
MASSTPASAAHAANSNSSPFKLAELSGVEAAKRAAAYAAVDNHVKPNHEIIGIGSGSTVPYVVERIAQQGESVNAKRWFIPTGFQSRELIINAGLRLGDVDSFPSIDVTIDGADEVDNALNCIKGGGACHLREKVLAEAARDFVVVADYRKNGSQLGTKWLQGVPIEVAPFAYAKVLHNLKQMGAQKPVLRMGKAKAGPVVTDNANFCIDAPFPEAQMKDPADLLKRIKLLTGVLEVGLFCNITKSAYFGNDDGTITIKTADGKVQEGVHFDVTQPPATA